MNPRARLHKMRVLGSGFKSSEYELYRLGDRTPEACVRFMNHRQLHRLYRTHVNQGGQKHILEDKWLSHFVFAGLGIPTPETLGLYHPVFGRTVSEEALTTERDFVGLAPPGGEVDWIFKPRGGQQGEQIHRFCGTVDNLGAFLERLGNTTRRYYGTRYDGWIVQQRLQQHADLQKINSSCINCVRIVTFHDTSGTITVDFSILRLGTAGSMADNWYKGSLSVHVDPDTGRMGQGVSCPTSGSRWYQVHPDSKVHFTGTRVPYWEDCVELSRRVAANFSGTPSVGWDIVVTPEGPVLVEGNANWGLESVQIHSDGYLTDPVRERLKTYDLEFPDQLRRLPAAVFAVLLNHLRRSRFGRRWNRPGPVF